MKNDNILRAETGFNTLILIKIGACRAKFYFLNSLDWSSLVYTHSTLIAHFCRDVNFIQLE
ncbi:hypothetical protein T05_568 [Trichinella murrelli]|uniref:Uncharacterized protein n=1 Tax=Trichinella murrelli TaxID=144512 RepID=A0A0V0UHD3_9BILA|nr:hypothetical protein T05_568 [Trichinella murrelli]